MPTSTWTVTVASTDAVNNVSATHYNSDGEQDASFTSSLKIGSQDELTKFVELAKEQLTKTAEKEQAKTDLVASIEDLLNK